MDTDILEVLQTIVDDDLEAEMMFQAADLYEKAFGRRPHVFPQDVEWTT